MTADELEDDRRGAAREELRRAEILERMYAPLAESEWYGRPNARCPVCRHHPQEHRLDGCEHHLTAPGFPGVDVIRWCACRHVYAIDAAGPLDWLT